MTQKSDRDAIPETIVFIQLPKQFTVGEAILLPDVPIPVELGTAKEFDVTMLKPESLTSGILRVLAVQPDHPHGAYYRKIVHALYPDITIELANEGILQARDGNYGVAENIFKALAGYEPEEAKHVLNLAVLYEQWAEYYAKNDNEELRTLYTDNAHDAYEQLLLWEPAFPDAFFNAAYFYANQNNFERAKSLFTTFVQLTNNEEKREKAKNALAKLAERSAHDDLFKEAYDAIKMGREEKGIELINKFLEHEPGVWNAWFLLGWAQRRLGNYDAGKQALAKAIELGGAMVDVYNEYSICAMELGDFSESRKKLELALKLEPENTKIISNLGVLAQKMKNYDEARGFFMTVLELDPHDTLAEAMLKKLQSS